MSDLKMGDFRFTIRVLKSGQQRAYGDTIGRYRITIEHVPYDTRIEPNWTPYDIPDDKMIRQWIKGIHGWSVDDTDKDRVRTGTMDEYFAKTLTEFRRVDKGIWEWEVRERYTD